MSLELIRESIKVRELIGEQSIDNVIESYIIVPDTKPDVEKILFMDGEIVVNSIDPLNDKAQINGAINFRILYLSDDEEQKTRGITTSANFSQTIDIPNTRNGMKCFETCSIEHMDYEILNGRKVNIKSIVNFKVRVYEEKNTEIVNNIEGIENIQVLTENMNIDCYIDSHEENFSFNDKTEIPLDKPTIRDILRYNLSIKDKEFDVLHNKVLARGTLNVVANYISDDEEQNIESLEYEIPFERSIDLYGVTEGVECNIQYKITDSKIEASEDTDGELRVIDGEFIFNIMLEGYEKRSMDVVKDGYSFLSRLKIQKDEIKTHEILSRNKSHVTVKESVIIGGENPNIKELLSLTSNPNLLEHRILEDNIEIEGIVNSKLLYTTNDPLEPVRAQNIETHFSTNIDVPGINPDMDCDISFDIENCDFNIISAREIEIRAILNVNTTALRNAKIPQITDVQELPVEDTDLRNEPSLKIYFAQNNDCLWDIAKKYCVRMDEIRKINPSIDFENLLVGQQIIIPKRNALIKN